MQQAFGSVPSVPTFRRYFHKRFFVYFSFLFRQAVFHLLPSISGRIIDIKSIGRKTRGDWTEDRETAARAGMPAFRTATRPFQRSPGSRGGDPVPNRHRLSSDRPRWTSWSETP